MNISDHNASAATLSFTKTEELAPSTERLRVTLPDPVGALTNKLLVTVRDLHKIAQHFDELVALVKG